MRKIILIITSFSMAALAQETTVITDIKNWKHPTKQIFTEHGFHVKKVVLINKIKPIFYVETPEVAATCDTAGLVQIFRELSKANAYWPFDVIDTGDDGLSLKVEISSNPQKRQFEGATFIRRKSCSEHLAYQRSFPSSGGKIDIFDISAGLDANVYKVKFGNISSQFAAEEFVLDGLKEVSPSQSGELLFLASFSGPGLNCHEQFRFLRIALNREIQISPPFGACSSVEEIQTHGASVVALILNNVSNETSRVVWENGKISEHSIKSAPAHP